MARISGVSSNDPVAIKPIALKTAANTFVTNTVAPTTTTSFSGSGSSGSAGSSIASKAVAREKIAFQKKTGLRDIAQSLQQAQDDFAFGLRDLNLFKTSGRERHQDVLRKIQDSRNAATLNLEQGLRGLQEQRDVHGQTRARGLRNINEFEEEETERVIDAVQARGLSRSGIQAEDEEDVAEDAVDDRFDLNTSINALLKGIKGQEGDLRANVKATLAALKG